jgi:hypothetical protein
MERYHITPGIRLQSLGRGLGLRKRLEAAKEGFVWQIGILIHGTDSFTW